METNCEFPLQSFRQGAISFAVNHKIYYGLGYSEDYNYKNDLWEYDIEDKAWTKKADFPLSAYSNGYSVVLNGKVYVCGGRGVNGYSISAFYEYDPLLDKWAKKTNYAAGAIDIYIAFTLAGKAYIGSSAQFYEYNAATNSWTQKASPSFNPQTIMYSDNRAMIYGGGYIDVNGKAVYANCFYRYDVNTDTWIKLADFPGPARFGAYGFVLADKIYLGAGKRQKESSLEFDMLTDLWEYTPE